MIPLPLLATAAFLSLLRSAWLLHSPLLAALALLGAVGAVSNKGWCGSRPDPRFLRGRPRLQNLPSTQATRTATRKLPDGEMVQWGGGVLPASAATTHFLVAGTTGSGKTLLLNTLLGSVLPFIGKCRPDGRPFNRRALVYDAKGDLLSTLQGAAGCRVVSLHPFDLRGAAWDLARDITTPAAALQAASLLVPLDRSGSGNPFFPLAAQNLVRGVLLSFQQTVGTDWTFRDLILALRYEERLRQVLEKVPEGRAVLDQFFQVGETLQGVRAMLATKTAPFEVIAAAWDAATERVSLQEFLEGEFVLVLGNDETCRTALDAVNRLLFQRLTELILGQTESRTRQTWLFLDEVREAGRLDGLSRLMTKGRSKGACVALGFQAIEGMWEVYGKNLADELVGLCNQKAILRLDSPVSAQWASELFGKREELEHRVSRSQTWSGWALLPRLGRGRAVAEQRLITEAVLASEVMTLPPTGPEHDLAGYFLTRTSGAYRQTLSWNEVMALQLPKADDVPDLQPRPESDQYLREWGQEDLDRLGLQPVRLMKDASATCLRPILRTVRTVRAG